MATPLLALAISCVLTAVALAAPAAPQARATGDSSAPAAAVRIALVSDTHMIAGDGEKALLHRSRFERTVAAVNGAGVDLVLVAGDLTEDGTEAELRDFASLAARFTAPVCVVPGNHDVGPKAIQAKKAGPSAERLSRYEAVLGPATYVRRVAGVRVLGIAAPVLGSGLPAEADAWKLLERECAAPAAGPTVLLTHYPPYTKKADEPSDPYWNLEPEPRARLLALLRRGGVRHVLAGHLHRPLDVRESDGLTLCVTPPVSFGLPAGKQQEGWTLVTLGADGGLTREFRPRDPNPARLRRADSFFGLHFDFHAGPDCTEVGRNTTPAMIGNLIEQVHPDYLQIDCKGHPGYSSYPTKVGKPVPGFVGDPLRVWREETARRGVALYMHYSGVYDADAVKRPGWAAFDAAGKPSARATSRFGPYAEQLLLPQLRELALDYGVDGVWADGECWASVPDYGDAAVKAFRSATGIATIPRKAGEPHWFEFLEFHRQQFRAYLAHYAREVKRAAPEFQVCSNWAYTDHMPEPVGAPVDFISGDYSPENSVNSARLAGRYLPRQGRPWDLMAWSFATKPEHRQKGAEQLKREAAVVLALGGGFQAYFKQRRDGSIFEDQVPVMAEVARFCRERQSLAHHAEAVPQVGVIFSTYNHYRSINSLFGRNNTRISGVLQALLENRLSVELLAEHHVRGRMAEYPLLVLPETEALEPAFREELLAYVRGGGSLLLVGPRSAALFAAELGIAPGGAPRENARVEVDFAGARAVFQSEIQGVQPGAAGRPLGMLRRAAADKAGTGGPGAGIAAAGEASPAATLAQVGRGRILATHFSLAGAYLKNGDPALRALAGALAAELFPEPLVRVAAEVPVDVCVARKGGRLLVHLVNTGGPHATQPLLERVEPVGPFEVSIRLPAAPSRVTIQPSHRELRGEFRDGRFTVRVPGLHLHEALVVEQAAAARE